MKYSGISKIKNLWDKKFFFGTIFFLVAIFCLPSLTVASPITPVAYVWSSKLGWINFSPDNGNVSVTDSALTGYAWSVQSGWINLAPDYSGVKNNGQGVLSGFAWGANTGWIDFSGVTINPATGLFSGSATGDIVGTLNFSCDECHVVTTWRPTASVPSSGGVVYSAPLVVNTAATTTSVAVPPALDTPVVKPGDNSVPSNETGSSEPTRPSAVISDNSSTESSDTVSPETAPTIEEIKPLITSDLTPGATDPQVKLLQEFLNTHGFIIASEGPGSAGEETDYFGTATKEALIKFQLANGIDPAEGIINEQTRLKIFEIQKNEKAIKESNDNIDSFKESVQQERPVDRKNVILGGGIVLAVLILGIGIFLKKRYK